MYQDKPDIDNFFLEQFIMSDDYLMHVGVDHIESTPGSGRYEFGSGENPYQHGIDNFLARVKKMRHEGFTWTDPETGKTVKGDTAIAKSMGMSTTEFRAKYSMEMNEEKTKLYNRAVRLREDGYGYSEIARKMGLPNESSVRSLLNKNSQNRREKATKTAEFLKQQIEEYGMIEIGAGTESNLGISKEKLKEAVLMLEEEGYQTAGGRIKNVIDPSGEHQTTLLVIGPKDMEKKDIYKYENIHFISDEDYNKFREEQGIDNLHEFVSRDNGETYEKRFVYPASMDSSRLMIRYAEDGGVKKDGVIEIRRGVEDLSLGESTYAQVRILVDNDHYLKGMALYSDNMPPGVDVIFNTNKSNNVAKIDVLKEIKRNDDGTPQENPFGSNVREEGGQYWYTDANGDRKLGLINKTRQEGDWSEWQDKVPSQFLSKQPLILAKRQLNLAIEDKVQEYNDILALENNTIKKYELEQFANDCDSASVHLQAAALPRQKHQVILPVDSMKDDEVYAPNYENGEKVALIRYPHGGTFEIPILTVNNKQPEASELLKGHTADCVAINSRVAARLSRADFDGDTVMVIPTNDKIKIKSTPELTYKDSETGKFKKLSEFDPKTDYGYSEKKVDSDGKEHYFNKYGKEYPVMKNTDIEMGVISNLITDMTLKGATDEEKVRAVKHSMVVIDAAKHKLDYKSSYRENRIDDLKKKYQDNGINPETGKQIFGASTLISKAKSEQQVLKTEGSPRVNIKGKPWYDPNRPEGALIFKVAGEDKLNYTVVKNPKTNKWVNAREKNGELFYNDSDDPKVKNYVKVTNEPIDIRTRTKKSTKMAETDDARSLISDYDTDMEHVYADFANTMKAMANQARKVAYETIDIRRSPTAAKTYAKEVQSLKTKIDISEKNPPRERQAQILAKTRIDIKKAASSTPLTKDQVKKLSDRELKKARSEVGAKRTPIDISNKEWEAIQAGAVSADTLKKIMRYSDKDKLKKLATPRKSIDITPTMVSRIKSMANNGKTNSEIAEALGISASTVSKQLTGD